MHLSNAFQLLELKYCECCGGLWLRRKGAVAIYCRACIRDMAVLPLRREPSPAPPRKPKAASPIVPEHSLTGRAL